MCLPACMASLKFNPFFKVYIISLFKNVINFKSLSTAKIYSICEIISMDIIFIYIYIYIYIYILYFHWRQYALKCKDPKYIVIIFFYFFIIFSFLLYLLFPRRRSDSCPFEVPPFQYLPVNIPRPDCALNSGGCMNLWFFHQRVSSSLVLFALLKFLCTRVGQIYHLATSGLTFLIT